MSWTTLGVTDSALQLWIHQVPQFRGCRRLHSWLPLSWLRSQLRSSESTHHSLQCHDFSLIDARNHSTPSSRSSPTNATQTYTCRTSPRTSTSMQVSTHPSPLFMTDSLLRNLPASSLPTRSARAGYSVMPLAPAVVLGSPGTCSFP